MTRSLETTPAPVAFDGKRIFDSHTFRDGSIFALIATIRRIFSDASDWMDESTRKSCRIAAQGEENRC